MDSMGSFCICCYELASLVCVKICSETLALVWMFIVLALLLLPITSIWRFCRGNDMEEIERAFSDEQCAYFNEEAVFSLKITRKSCHIETRF